MLLVLAACGSTPAPTPILATTSSQPTTAPPASPSRSTTPSAAVRRSPVPGPRVGANGSVALLGADGSLTLVEAGGRTIELASAADGTFVFPAWSPDGTRIAAMRQTTTDHAIVVFDAPSAASGAPAEPRVIFQHPTIAPFYMSWTPDGTRVSFLADEGGGLSLRIAPADGSAPLDGSGPGATIRSGNPLYYDWIGGDRLMAHIGAGAGAFLGEIALDGSSVAPAIQSPGDFRSAVVSADGSFAGYARVSTGGGPEVVVTGRDGSNVHPMPVFGPAAVEFDPTGHTLASIGPTAARAEPLAIPVGPIRLIDAETGRVRVLLDGDVVSFWWSPDGKTIAAIRIQPIEDAVASPSPAGSAAAPSQEIRLVFVDVASGSATSRVIAPGQLFIDQLLTYFDQYQLSHRLWAPDSSSILIPIARPSGETLVAVVPRNGDPQVLLDGVIGFWSPELRPSR